MATITLNGAPIHTQGFLPEVGSQAPDFIATKIDLSDMHLKDYLGKRVILNIFPSLDTSTCAAAMKHFNDLAAKVPNDIILCISADLPFAQKRFCTDKNLQNVHPVSVFRFPDFGTLYGVKIMDGALSGLLSRAVVVIDKQGKVTYTEQVRELSAEPNYEALAAIL